MLKRREVVRMNIGEDNNVKKFYFLIVEKYFKILKLFSVSFQAYKTRAVDGQLAGQVQAMYVRLQSCNL